MLTGSTASGYPVSDVKAALNPAGNGFATVGLFCATTDYSATTFVDARLANGGTIATHDDCTELRRLSKQLTTTKQFLESVIDNIPVCVAAKSIDDSRYILANRAFENYEAAAYDALITLAEAAGDDARQASLWQARIFNPGIANDAQVLGFRPDWKTVAASIS